MTDIHPGINIHRKVSKDTIYLIRYLREDHSHKEKIAQVLKHAEVNKGKIKSLSRRNQKRLLSRLGWYWNKDTGKLIDKLKYDRSKGKGPYCFIPIEHCFVEKVNPPMHKFMEAWVDNFIGK